jgi:hypothetical protein
MTVDDLGAGDKSSDSDDRVQQFLARHGGPGMPKAASATDALGASGWSEVYAADGYILRCDWSSLGDRQEMKFTETPPAHR